MTDLRLRRWLDFLPVLILLGFSGLTEPASACSTFYFVRNGCSVFGRNYDWMVEDGYLMVNKRGVKKTAFVIDRPASWVSRFGSLTFNQYGREFPVGGMNEAGLVVENMWLDEARYPNVDDRQAVNCLQWIQYQLDTSASVDDVVASDRKIRISNAELATLHYLVADKSGQCAVVEFLGGKMICHRNKDRSPMALTNDTYQASLRYWKDQDGSAVDIPSSTRSLDRFVRSLAGAHSCKPTDADQAVDQAFAILNEVAQGDFTKWSVVYDIANARIHFRTFSAERRRFVEIRKFDLSCREPVMVLNLTERLSGEVSNRFQQYRPDLNRTLVIAWCAKTPFLKGIPTALLELYASYPETTSCQSAQSEAAATPSAHPAAVGTTD